MRAVAGVVLLLLAALATGVPATAEDNCELAHLTRVIDGDTIEVDIDGAIHAVRYIGVGAPERDSTYYEAATEVNREWVEGEPHLCLISDVEPIDKYGRLLRYVFLPDLGPMANVLMVESGWAIASRHPPNVDHADEFTRAEIVARRGRFGMWQFVVPRLNLPIAGGVIQCIDINSASVEELQLLWGIGPVKAKAIIDGRPYETLDDLLRMWGIGPVTLSRIKEQGIACVR